MACRGKKDRREGGEQPSVFKLCLYVSPDCECATALHNGGHCLFGGESVGILFQSFLEVLCLTWWGLSTSRFGGRLGLCAHFCGHVSSPPSVLSFTIFSHLFFCFLSCCFSLPYILDGRELWRCCAPSCWPELYMCTAFSIFLSPSTPPLPFLFCPPQPP